MLRLPARVKGYECEKATSFSSFGTGHNKRKLLVAKDKAALVLEEGFLSRLCRPYVMRAVPALSEFHNFTARHCSSVECESLSDRLPVRLFGKRRVSAGRPYGLGSP